VEFPEQIQAILNSLDTQDGTFGYLCMPVNLKIYDRLTHEILREGEKIIKLRMNKKTLAAIDQCAKQYGIAVEESRLIVLRAFMQLQMRELPNHNFELHLNRTPSWEEEQ
jgi:hypothetical protein